MTVGPGRFDRYAVRALGALFFLMGGLAAAGSWIVHRSDLRLLRDGPRAEGRVLDKSVVRASDGDSDFVVRYEFALPSGERLRGERGLPRSAWDALRKGGAVTVVYDAARPQRHFPLGGGVTSTTVTVFVSALGGTLAVFGAALVRSQRASGGRPSDTLPHPPGSPSAP